MTVTIGQLAPLWGFLPFIIIIAGLLITAILFGVLLAVSKIVLPPEILAEILFSMGTIWLGIMFVLMVMRVSGCMQKNPWEAFTDMMLSPSDSLNALEAEVCKQLQEVLVFKQSDLGQTAIDNPAILADAIHAMIQAAGGPTTECTAPLPLSSQGQAIPPLEPTGIPVTDEMFIRNSDDIKDRLDRAFRTLKFVIEPQAVATFNTMDTCKEGFNDLVQDADAGSQNEQDALMDQLETCRTLATSIRSHYLEPIKQKQADLRAGKLSDCDRQKGAQVGMK